MKSSMVLVVFFAVALAAAQTTTTQTDCNIYGSTASCTSTSTSDAADRAARAEQQREMYETGQQIGQGLGNVTQGLRARHFVKKFCKQHGAGATWWYQFQGQPVVTGTCEGQGTEEGQAFDNKLAVRDLCSNRGYGDSHPQCRQIEAEAASWHTQHGCENDKFFWWDNSCHAARQEQIPVARKDVPQEASATCPNNMSRVLTSFGSYCAAH
jgi:hypothetical protein